MNFSKSQTQISDKEFANSVSPFTVKAILQKLSCFVVLATTFIILTSEGCNKSQPVTIKYRQVLNWYEFKHGLSSQTAHQGMFMMYKITSIDNTKSSKAFTLNVANLYVKNVEGEHDFGSTAGAHLLHKAENITVSAGQEATDIGCIFFRVAGDNPQSMALTLLPLQYHYDGSEKGHLISIVREANNSTVPYANPATADAFLTYCPNE